MLKVHVTFHKDGDHVEIWQEPWWSDIYEWLVSKLTCPCCGLSGWISGKSETIEVLFYRIWNNLLNVTFKRSKSLYAVPVPFGCVAHEAIFGNPTTCFRDECPYCLDQRDDAASWKGE